TLGWWSPVKNAECRLSFNSLKELRKLRREFAAHSRYFADYSGPLFKSRDLGNYQVLKDFPGATTGIQLPSKISSLLSQPGTGQHVGAFPPVP
ncbi:MAG: right-handed parallel beta-helix repeat-containing protein, partial [Fidelibacterota bacterium]